MKDEIKKDPQTRQEHANKDEIPASLVFAVSDLQKYRPAIAHFLAEAINWPEEIIGHCDANGWNESVGYDLREALFKLGCVLGTLVTWEEDAGLTRDQIVRIDRRLHGESEDGK